MQKKKMGAVVGLCNGSGKPAVAAAKRIPGGREPDLAIITPCMQDFLPSTTLLCRVDLQVAEKIGRLLRFRLLSGCLERTRRCSLTAFLPHFSPFKLGPYRGHRTWARNAVFAAPINCPVWSKYSLGRFGARSRMMYGHHAKQKMGAVLGLCNRSGKSAVAAAKRIPGGREPDLAITPSHPSAAVRSGAIHPG